ncbi:monovalent cation/H+ antiporter subunit D [Marinimicrobium sp. ABcell2]|uniref:monovalent cation/H+ antiporter subunit D n=1 Tax=Marinimicrobium sp. ABcell2 TaxID=3069751 RepID=UPI0027B05E6E|nr:monovalent cation/H+ antiporter subunit D [Marinimicrobium sp. ABcell2]MDQ2075366.1 monovalent cation/H+ antiporter subunit D [Marinimicrobium sp. ABcell2]
MQHWITLPIMLPLCTGVALIFMARAHLDAKRAVSLISALLSIPVTAVLLIQAGAGEYQVYAVGNWQPPYGIALVLDRFAAMMLMMTSILGLLALLYGIRSDDKGGRNYHALFHFQLMGLQGAFLTGDLFNLFVFFEITLISSYGLLMHGAGPERTRASLHYVILNLAGSALFLIGVGTLYGVLGTLNLADLAIRISEVAPEDAPLVLAAGLILLVVFGLKAAMLPLYFWLPNAYSSASPSVASLFAIMTKLGIYSILRVHGLLFGPEAGVLENAISTWLWPIALLTMIFGAIGVLGARTLKRVVSYLVIVSVGTVLAIVATDDLATWSGGLYYLIHSTFITAALFLLADIISNQRGQAKDYLKPAQPLRQPRLLGSIFFIAAVSVAGLPPLSGFISKASILQASAGSSFAPALWLILLAAGLITLVSMSRAGSTIFWSHSDDSNEGTRRADKTKLGVALLLLLVSPLMTVYGEALLSYCQATAEQLRDTSGYIDAVMPIRLSEEL